MRISRVRIINFANFRELDIATGDNIVVVGENKVGKSNFIHALRLVLDPALSERDRHLGLDDFWDGLGEDKLGASVEVLVELTDFTGDERLMAHLCGGRSRGPARRTPPSPGPRTGYPSPRRRGHRRCAW